MGKNGKETLSLFQQQDQGHHHLDVMDFILHDLLHLQRDEDQYQDQDQGRHRLDIVDLILHDLLHLQRDEDQYQGRHLLDIVDFLELTELTELIDRQYHHNQ